MLGCFSLLADFFMSIYLKIIRGGKEGNPGGKKLATEETVKIDVKLYSSTFFVNNRKNWT